MLAHARGNRLLVRLNGSVRDADAEPPDHAGSILDERRRRRRTAPASRGSLRVLGLTNFVSSNGVGGILAECLASTPCHTSTTVSVGETVIASTGSELLGARDVGYLIFSLTSAGKSMLAHAHGNQLGRVGDDLGRRRHRDRRDLARGLPLISG